ncbi:40S ribosomal protein S15a-5-like isoform X1 [Diospyros lotus]|uniref:40S ribosomal protein S15a-5-like isoform X1 n=1 Tax=Diospyros lotus TaxID=55363 RepID=UPI002254C799|nr:40S ribosomal protein S15a-5-like isoform X1 [Diospyros lotus]
MGRRILNDALRTIVNAEKRGFASAQLQPVSNVMASFLNIMKHRGLLHFIDVVSLDSTRMDNNSWENGECSQIHSYGAQENQTGYIKDFQVYDPHRVGRITVELQGRIKDCRALMYRQDVKAQDIEQYRLGALPTHQWGYVVITTPNGVLDHEEAIRQNVGGQVLGYFY